MNWETRITCGARKVNRGIGDSRGGGKDRRGISADDLERGGETMPNGQGRCFIRSASVPRARRQKDYCVLLK